MSRLGESLHEERRPFDEPWQAEAFALVQVLIETGRFAASDWATTFGAALRQAAKDGEPDNSETYYAALVKALEQLLIGGGMVKDVEAKRRVEDWRAAYHRTPHGKPVRLDGPAETS